MRIFLLRRNNICYMLFTDYDSCLVMVPPPTLTKLKPTVCSSLIRAEEEGSQFGKGFSNRHGQVPVALAGGRAEVGPAVAVRPPLDQRRIRLE